MAVGNPSKKKSKTNQNQIAENQDDIQANQNKTSIQIENEILKIEIYNMKIMVAEKDAQLAKQGKTQIYTRSKSSYF